jgi:hypothetical protein
MLGPYAHENAIFMRDGVEEEYRDLMKVVDQRGTNILRKK